MIKQNVSWAETQTGKKVNHSSQTTEENISVQK